MPKATKKTATKKKVAKKPAKKPWEDFKPADRLEVRRQYLRGKK